MARPRGALANIACQHAQQASPARNLATLRTEALTCGNTPGQLEELITSATHDVESRLD